MLLSFLTINQERVVEALYQSILQHVKEQTLFHPETLRENVKKISLAFLHALQEESSESLDICLQEFVQSRTVEEFPLALLHRTFTVFSTMLPELLHECHGHDYSSISHDLQRLHLLINTTLTTLVAHYETRSKALVRHQQEQLQAYSRGLEDELIQVGEKFQTLQEFNKSILQSMPTGLLVVDKITHRILRVNHALERLSGLSSQQFVGRTVEEAFSGWQGIPWAFFNEEVERHGRIMLGKYRLLNARNEERYRTIQGHVLWNERGDEQGVLILVDDISEMETLRETLNRYLSPQVVAHLLESQDGRVLRSSRREVTVLFADLRGFTSFAELRPPEDVVEALNQYLEVMVQAVFAHYGMLDKFLGDGLLALFGTPLALPEHPRHAVQAALAMQQALLKLNVLRQQQGLPTLAVGIGINSGEAIVGNIGATQRMEYTAVGDMVNVAQRLQSQAEGGSILLSERVLQHVQSFVTVHEILEMQVKGRQQPVRAYRIGPRQP